jgi:hypothetical protein
MININMFKVFISKFPDHLRLLIFLVVFTYSAGINPISAQKHEAGIFLGTSYYLGDINPERHFMMPGIGLGGVYRYNLNPHVSFRANGLFGQVASSDATIQFNPNRNLQFRSSVMELSIQTEINFLPFIAGDKSTPYTPYIFGGGGAFYYNPQAELDGTWFDLRSLKTEGQGSELYPERNPYAAFSGNILFGAGFKFNLSQRITAGFEWGLRRTFTDYLDDISTTYPEAGVFGPNSIGWQLHDRSLENRYENQGFQRGNPNRNDWYSFAGIVLTIRFKNDRNYVCPAYK